MLINLIDLCSYIVLLVLLLLIIICATARLNLLLNYRSKLWYLICWLLDLVIGFFYLIISYICHIVWMKLIVILGILYTHFTNFAIWWRIIHLYCNWFVVSRMMKLFIFIFIFVFNKCKLLVKCLKQLYKVRSKFLIVS